MVTEDKIIDSLLLRYRLGTLLVWLGVFTWLPFIFLRAVGEKPPFLYFLPFHLIGVIGGSRLRSLARKELGMAPPRKSPLLLAGHLMIFLGILVWAPYLYLKLAMRQPVEVMDFLPYHLTGILGGLFLHVLSYMIERHRSRGAQ
jgi:hypothetical protein